MHIDLVSSLIYHAKKHDAQRLSVWHGIPLERSIRPPERGVPEQGPFVSRRNWPTGEMQD